MAGPLDSCLPTDALAHFEQREQELLALNSDIEGQRLAAEAQSAVASAALAAEVPPRTPGLRRPGAPEGRRTPVRRPSRGAAVDEAEGAGDGEGHLHTTIRFQNARIVALQEELNKTMQELSARDKDATQLRRDVLDEVDENRRLEREAAAREQSHEQAKARLAELEVQARELDRGTVELRKERDHADLQCRKSEAEARTKDNRINSLVDEGERCKAAMKDLTSEEKGRAQGDRRETERLTAEVRKIERQKSELVAAFKKQMKLIDVLKRQRAHCEAARVLAYTEDEFLRLLELGDRLDG